MGIYKSPQDKLNEAIHTLQVRQSEELIQLKTQMLHTYESLKPINVIRGVWQEVIYSPEIKNGLLNNGIGLAAGFVSKKILMGWSPGPLKKMLGNIFEFGVASFISRHADPIKSTGKKIFDHIFKEKEIINEES